jgi:DNA modification methylase
MPDCQLGHSQNVEQIAVASLREASRNARTHTERQIDELARSISRFSFTNPILVDDANNVVAGHGRLAAAKKLGMATVPCLRLSGLSEQDKRAYMLADNKLALNAGWDRDILAIELKELSHLGFDLTIAGFEIGEVEIAIGAAEQADPTSTVDVDDDSPVPEAKAVTRFGDVWDLGGRHRLLCGNARSSEDVTQLMGDEVADMLFTDPPYNVPIDGHVSGLGRTRHREFDEACGEMSQEEFTSFLSETLRVAAAVCRDGAIAYVCMDWRHLRELLAAGHEIFTELKNLCVWNKGHGGMGAFYRSQHELVLVWKNGTAPHVNTFGLGDKGRYRTNVWNYAGVNSFRADRMEELSLHPTVKPVAMVADAIRDVTHRNNVVLDTFGGSGTTLIAAERTGRRARLLEIDPLYCDVIVRRWERLTGKMALLASSGATFERTAALRTGWSSKITVTQEIAA